VVPLRPEPCPDLRPALAGLGVEARVVATSLICAPLFNKVVAGSGSKGTVLTAGVCGLLGAVARSVPAGEPVLVQVDQLGGRRFYGPLLQAAFPDCWVAIEAEGADESRYRVEAGGREVRVVVRPRADGEGVSVALASMLAKYLREVCMRQFNRFWAQHVPGLKPTAGYPTDARRFFEDIRPAMAKLGIAEELVWRVR
jgi:GNAT superfamily N-acetyltransferase